MSTTPVLSLAQATAPSFQLFADHQKGRLVASRDEEIRFVLNNVPYDQQRAMIDQLNIITNQALRKIGELESYAPGEVINFTNGVIDEMRNIKCTPIERSRTDALFAGLRSAIETAAPYAETAAPYVVGGAVTVTVFGAHLYSAEKGHQRAWQLALRATRHASEIDFLKFKAERVAELTSEIADDARKVNDTTKRLYKKEAARSFALRYPFVAANENVPRGVHKHLSKTRFLQHDTEVTKNAAKNLVSRLGSARKEAREIADVAGSAFAAAQKRAAAVVVPAVNAVASGIGSAVATEAAIMGAKAVGGLALKALSIPAQVLFCSSETGAAELIDPHDASMTFLAPKKPLPTYAPRHFGKQML